MNIHLVATSLLICVLLPSVSFSVDCLSKVPKQIEARNYWNYLHNDKFQQTGEDETFIYGVISFHCDAKVKVSKLALNNRQDKEAAYLNILINSVLSMNDHKDKDISKAKELTGMEFETQFEWIEWLSKNNKLLKLSEDGSILVVKRCKKTEGLDKVIAKVGAMRVTYDEIDDDGCDEYSKNREITALINIIKDEVLEQELNATGYNPSETEIERMAIEINNVERDSFGQNIEDRVKIMEQQRVRMLLVIKALDIWKEDKVEGDEFATKELIHSGITQETWESIKSQSNNPELIEMLNVWEEIEDITPSNLKEIQLRFQRDRFIKQAKTRLKLEKLKTSVVPDYIEMNETDRENEFRAWLRKRMAEKTVIYNDNYKLALEIDFFIPTYNSTAPP